MHCVRGHAPGGCHCDSSEQKGSFGRYIRLELFKLAAAWNALAGRAVCESVCSFANSNNHDISDVAFYLTGTCKSGSYVDDNCHGGHNASSSWASDILRYNGCNLSQSDYKRDSTVDQRRYCRATSRPWGRQPQLQSILRWKQTRRDAAYGTGEPERRTSRRDVVAFCEWCQGRHLVGGDSCDRRFVA